MDLAVTQIDGSGCHLGEGTTIEAATLTTELPPLITLLADPFPTAFGAGTLSRFSEAFYVPSTFDFFC